jgi:hypothetical protein
MNSTVPSITAVMTGMDFSRRSDFYTYGAIRVIVHWKGSSVMGSWERGGGHCAKRESDRDTEQLSGKPVENKHEHTYKMYVYMLNGRCN